MINYIRDFFSCRDCSENFNSHVASIGYLPRNPDQSLLWLWTIHNTANVLLSGDPTEDPQVPKIRWPSQDNCPACRRNGFGNRWSPMLRVNGELWNQDAVLDYLRKVYSADSIITYEREEVTAADNIKIILDKLKTNTSAPNDGAFQEAEEELLEICAA